MSNLFDETGETVETIRKLARREFRAGRITEEEYRAAMETADKAAAWCAEASEKAPTAPTVDEQAEMSGGEAAMRLALSCWLDHITSEQFLAMTPPEQAEQGAAAGLSVPETVAAMRWISETLRLRAAVDAALPDRAN
jgi:hypothetical protein